RRRSAGAATHRTPPQRAVVEALGGPAHGERLERAAQAAHLLCEVLWEALHDELGVRRERAGLPNVNSAPTQRTAALAERLADVAATVALLASADRGVTVSPRPGVADTARAAASAANHARKAQYDAER